MSSGIHEKELVAKIHALQERMENLRLGRRILMNLLEATEEEKNWQLKQLREENNRLRTINSKLARQVMFMKGERARTGHDMHME